MDQFLLPRWCQYDGCTHCVDSNGYGRFCFIHGGRPICSHALCLNFAQAGGGCIKHGYKKPTCIVDGCSNQHVARGLCKRHGGHHLCNVINCTHHVFRHNMCRSHYSSTNQSSTVMNKSITVSTTTIFLTKSGTLTTSLGNAMEIDIVVQKVIEFVGMGNWEQVHTFAAVCKCWRHSSLPHLSNIGKVPMDGGGERRLNVSAFLRLLQSEHFRNVQAIFIPCGKTKGLFMNDIKRRAQVFRPLSIVNGWWWMGQWRKYRKEKDGIVATEFIVMTCLLQRVQMYGFNLSGTKIQTCVGIIVCCTCFLTKTESV